MSCKSRWYVESASFFGPTSATQCSMYFANVMLRLMGSGVSQQIYSILFIQDNVANFMHIVGGICGTAFGFAVRKR